jgi:D-hexose-6-phosphate mutarotase
MPETFLQIHTPQDDLLKVYSLGAKIEVALGGVPILGSFQRGDGKFGITHPCTPIFGPDRKNIYGLSQHGNMRGEECSVRQEENDMRVSYMVTDQGYPAGMKVEQKMSIENGRFIFQMTHTNTGNKEAAVNAGEHCYFDAPLGFEGTRINGLDISPMIKDNFDGISIDLDEKNLIKIPGKPTYELLQKGFRKAVVWVGKNPESKQIDANYICIEPVEDDPFGDFFGSPESMIVPGESRIVRFTLKIQK